MGNCGGYGERKGERGWGRSRGGGGERERDYCVVILSFSPTSAHPE